VDLNPAHVRTLREIARHGSFSRAAESLRLSQPAVSLHMRQLEARCGTALLERVGKRAFPTPAGAVLLEHAGRAFAELEAAQEALRQLRGVVAGRLRLGTGATASIHLLPPLLRRMRARYPELELIVVTGAMPPRSPPPSRPTSSTWLS
jgi:DNA-binding transcriptional LysR family regulator